MEFIIWFYTFPLYKEYMICLISFSKLSDVLPTFTCASAIGNLRNICFGVKILICVAKLEGRPSPFRCL